LLTQRLDRDESTRSVHSTLDLAACFEQPSHLFEQRDELRLELIPVRDRPLLVAVVREQSVAVQLDRRRVGVRIAVSTRARGCDTPRVDVDPRALRRQGENVPCRGDQTLTSVRVDRPPRVVHRLAQIGGRRGRGELRPKNVHRLLALQSMTRRQREQPDETGRLAPPPRSCRNNARGRGDAKPAEQLDPQ
jgi:hypothetical protein